jgi:predicted acetyltransferase
MDKSGTIEKMLEEIFIIKQHGVRGVGLDAVYELKGMCEKIIALHASPKRASGHCKNGDKAPLTLVSDDSKDAT